MISICALRSAACPLWVISGHTDKSAPCPRKGRGVSVRFTASHRDRRALFQPVFARSCATAQAAIPTATRTSRPKAATVGHKNVLGVAHALTPHARMTKLGASLERGDASVEAHDHVDQDAEAVRDLVAWRAGQRMRHSLPSRPADTMPGSAFCKMRRTRGDAPSASACARASSVLPC